MNEFLNKIRRELESNVEIPYKKMFHRVFKEEVHPLGVRTPIVRRIANKYFKEVKNLSKKEILQLCNKLLDSRINEETTIAFAWTYKLKKQYNESDFNLFEKWLKKYVTSWGTCDDFCIHTINHFVNNYPRVIPKVKSWAFSKNRWLRRASSVSFITPGFEYFVTKENHKHVFEVAKTLLDDTDDLVQKGYGWMLKSASVINQKAVLDFVMKHKKVIPRTALRYAIEKMPEKLRKQAMKKD